MTDDTSSSTPAVGGLSRHVGSWAPESVTDARSPGPAAALTATPDTVKPTPGALRPPWHWLHFLEWPSPHELGAGGADLQGHFPPSLSDRRRVIAGGRVECLAPLRTGVPAARHGSVGTVQVEHGSCGGVEWVTGRSATRQGETLRATEEECFVHRHVAAEARSA